MDCKLDEGTKRWTMECMSHYEQMSEQMSVGGAAESKDHPAAGGT